MAGSKYTTECFNNFVSIAKCAVFTIHYFLGQIDVGNFVSFIYAMVFRIHFFGGQIDVGNFVSFIYAMVFRIHFVKNQYCLPPDTHTYVSESEGNNSFMEHFAYILIE